jgi:hypothetical protein
MVFVICGLPLSCLLPQWVEEEASLLRHAHSTTTASSSSSSLGLTLPTPHYTTHNPPHRSCPFLLSFISKRQQQESNQAACTAAVVVLVVAAGRVDLEEEATLAAVAGGAEAEGCGWSRPRGKCRGATCLRLSRGCLQVSFGCGLCGTFAGVVCVGTEEGGGGGRAEEGARLLLCDCV